MKSFFKKLLQQKIEINYLYFSFFLLFLSILSLSHYLSWDQSLFGIPLFFLFYAVGQAFLEVCLFVLLAYLLKIWTPRWTYLIFISVSFVLMLLHFTNFIMVRLMDASVGYIFKFFFGSGVDHFIAGFQALNMNATMIVIIVGTFLIIPLVGIGFYWLTFRLSNRKPLNISFLQIAMVIAIIGTSLFVLDLLAHPYLDRLAYNKYQKTLPLGRTFIPPISNQISLQSPFASVRDEKETEKNIPKLTLANRPNIYLFVIETFRRDFIDEKTAPNLIAFADENIQFERSFANASSTHLSWFAIFHSDLPFHWAAMRDTWKNGSVSLQLLKKLGYKIHVKSSADLRYFSMDKLIFGTERQLADSIEEYSFNHAIEPCDRDALALNSLKRDLQSEWGREGNVFIIFLDATHSEYSFPKDYPLKFQPISKEIDYLTIGPKSPDLELIKNRYRNAIHYIDDLMGNFFSLLRSQNLTYDSIIAITGDHGEEFFEEGALFHGTHLNTYQTNVPIFLKFPSKEWVSQTDEATHMDIFPSILHYLTKQSDFTSLFDGKSIFGLDRLPFRIAVMQNGPDTPIEFTIENTDLKLHAGFLTPTTLEIIELQGSLEPGIFTPLLK